VRIFGLALGVLLIGCPAANDDDSAPLPEDDDDATEEPLEPTWSNVFDMLSFRCGCHDAQQAEGDLYDLTDPDSAWGLLVNVPSVGLPGMDRVEPGDAEASYLYLKISDTHRAAGGDGNRMPPTGFPLTETKVTMVRDWIEDGAIED